MPDKNKSVNLNRYMIQLESSQKNLDEQNQITEKLKSMIDDENKRIEKLNKKVEDLLQEQKYEIIEIVHALNKNSTQVAGPKEDNKNQQHLREDLIHKTEEIENIRENILKKYSNFKVLFQQTSIYDLISIVQLVSYGLSVFDEKFFDLSELLENYIYEFNCKSLILFDRNGIIISEFYNSEIEPEYYVELLESIKEHLFLLKRMQQESYEAENNLTTNGSGLLSYLHRIKIGEESLFISVIIQEKYKDPFMEKFSEFLIEIRDILTPILRT